jgi:4-hydroxybenzoate polyprenyltransferase
VSVLTHESRTTWRFVYRDLTVTLVPGCLLVLAAGAHTGATPRDTTWALARSTLYLALFIYVFCVANQLGEDPREDQLNKPDRPLPSGMVTRTGAWLRWTLAMSAFTLVGWALGVLEWALLWQAITVVNNFTAASRWGPTRDGIIAVGAIVQLAAVWHQVAPPDTTAWRWILTLAVLFAGLGLHLVDLRDLHGDRAIGRRTFPVILGETTSRRYLASVMTALPAVLYLVLYAPQADRPAALPCTAAVTILSWTVAHRVITQRTPAADRTTYTLYTALYCLVLASGALVL